MVNSPTKREVEIKLRIESPRAARRILRERGFRLRRPRVFEDNLVFDMAGSDLRKAGKLLRVRKAGKKAVMTYKGPGEPGRHKSREEIEMVVSSAKTAVLALERLGFTQVFRYQKYRTEYARPGERGVVMMDETPIGCFLEVEGNPRWIDRTARRLGFEIADYITASYGGLYLEQRSRHRRLPADMVFAGRTT